MQKIIRFSKKKCTPFLLITLILCLSFSIRSASCEELKVNKALDEKVRMFLENRKGTWRHWNIPYSDGKILYDLILKNKYTKAIEIGTSTGLSAIWFKTTIDTTSRARISISYKTAAEWTEKLYMFKSVWYMVSYFKEIWRQSGNAFSTPITGVINHWCRSLFGWTPKSKYHDRRRHHYYWGVYNCFRWTMDGISRIKVIFDLGRHL